jgi:hypothetical protein
MMHSIISMFCENLSICFIWKESVQNLFLLLVAVDNYKTGLRLRKNIHVGQYTKKCHQRLQYHSIVYKQ